MKILGISGSTRAQSANLQLLRSFPKIAQEHDFELYPNLNTIPIFTADADRAPWPPPVISWRKAVAEAKGLIICTPEYIHNMPALIKNALEWVTSSGELHHKKVLPITFTPAAPRGKQAMQSLLWSLQALNANIVGQLDLYQNELDFSEDGDINNDEVRAILKEAFSLF